MVVVPKSNGKVRICVDLTKLNESVHRELHPLPAVEQTLAQIAGAKVFQSWTATQGFGRSLWTRTQPLNCIHHTLWSVLFQPITIWDYIGSEHFQRRMSTLLTGLDGYVCLIDDILVQWQDAERAWQMTPCSPQSTFSIRPHPQQGEMSNFSDMGQGGLGRPDYLAPSNISTQ